MKIIIGSDHTGFELKQKIIATLEQEGHQVEDKGAFSYDPADDYPDFIRPVALAVAEDKESLGIVMGGSGQGEAMCANRIKGIRAALFYGTVLADKAVDIEGNKSEDPFEIVKLARTHNNANILSLGTRFLTDEQAIEAIKIFLQTPFEGVERHERRINKLDL